MDEMARIGIVHHDIMTKGGGETVCMNVLEALQQKHEITLLTLSKPDFGELNRYFSTDVKKVDIDRARRLDQVLTGAQSIAGKEFYLLRGALLNRIANERSADFDLLISTINELDFETKSVQYVHIPQFIPSELPNGARTDFPLSSIHDSLCRRIAGFDRSHVVTESHLFANSMWTAEIFERLYRVRPEVLYPPVNVEEIAALGKSWAERDDGFLIVGRIVPHKDALRAIRIVDQLYSHGHEIHLHIIGPTADNEYTHEVQERANRRDYVRFEGEVSRRKLLEMMSTHKYGLHCAEHERFGIVVAEMVAAGMLPFVPNSGGQTEVVSNADLLAFETSDEAVSNISQVLRDSDLQSRLKNSLPEPYSSFGRDRFKHRIQTAVSTTL